MEDEIATANMGDYTEGATQTQPKGKILCLLVINDVLSSCKEARRVCAARTCVLGPDAAHDVAALLGGDLVRHDDGVRTGGGEGRKMEHRPGIQPSPTAYLHVCLPIRTLSYARLWGSHLTM